MPEKKVMQSVKDLFLILIYTGMRFSDLYNLKPVNINLEQGIIELVQKKTSDSVIIPIHNRLKEIFLKYPNQNIPKLSSQHFNDLVKLLCRDAGLTRKEQIVEFYGKKRVESVVERWELCSSHVGRNTFITNSLKMNIIPDKIMKISGHRSRSAFQTYVKLSKEEAVDDIRRAWDGIM